MGRIGFAIVGCGEIAKKHISSIAAIKEADLVAVCDINIERMKQAIALYREKSLSSSTIVEATLYQELLTNPLIHVVIISTLSALHADVAIEALRANKHIMLEKPIALSLQDADSIIQTANERGLYVQVCHQLRYRPILQEIKQLITQGDMGQIRLGSIILRLNRLEAYYKAANWRGSWDQDGGMLLNQGIHVIDLLRWYLGEPTEVSCNLAFLHPYKETEDIAAAWILFAGGAIGMVEANSITLTANLEQSLCLIGDKGTISIGGPSLNRIDRWYIEGKPDSIDHAAELLKDSCEHLYMYQAMLHAIESGKSDHLIGAVEGRQSLELIFGMYLSAFNGGKESLPISQFSTSMMKG